MHRTIYFSILAMLAVTSVQIMMQTQTAYADLENPTCLELGTCTCDYTEIYKCWFEPFTSYLGEDTFYALMGGGFPLMMILFRTRNIMITALIGVVIFASLREAGYIGGISESWIMYATLLIIGAFATAAYTMWKKLHTDAS